MLSNKDLIRIIDLAPSENDHWDFKLQWYKKNDRNNLLLDIINMVNTPHHDDCYIIIGIDDVTGKIRGIENDEGRMNKQNLQDFLRSKPFAQNFYPLTDVTTYEVYSPTKQKRVEIDVITIFNENNIPLYLDEDIEGDYKLGKNGNSLKDNKGKKIRKHKITSGLIYSRVNDSNTPYNRSTNDAQMELLWKKRFRLDLNIFSQFKHYLKDVNNWFYTETEHKPKYIYQLNPDFLIEEAKDDDEAFRGKFVCWSQTLMNVRVDFKIVKLKYRGIVIKEYVATVMDGGRFIACDPETGSTERIDNKKYFHYYVEDSLRYFVNEMIDNVSFPNNDTRSWEGYNQIKENLVVFKNNSELEKCKTNSKLQSELDEEFCPDKECISRLSSKIRNNREYGDKLWCEPEGAAQQFLVEKHNAEIVNRYLKDYRSQLYKKSSLI